MSGGSLDYVYCKVNDAASTVRDYAVRRKDRALLEAFADHLDKVSNCLHSIEWDFSGDTNLNEQEYLELRSLLNKQAELVSAIRIAKEAEKILLEVIQIADKNARPF
jgi:hypothetical protein